jgi:hypothetical protein
MNRSDVTPPHRVHKLQKLLNQMRDVCFGPDTVVSMITNKAMFANVTTVTIVTAVLLSGCGGGDQGVDPLTEAVMAKNRATAEKVAEQANTLANPVTAVELEVAAAIGYAAFLPGTDGDAGTVVVNNETLMFDSSDERTVTTNFCVTAVSGRAVVDQCSKDALAAFATGEGVTLASIATSVALAPNLYVLDERGPVTDDDLSQAAATVGTFDGFSVVYDPGSDEDFDARVIISRQTNGAMVCVTAGTDDRTAVVTDVCARS